MYCDVIYCDVIYCDVIYCDVIYCDVMYCDVMYCDVIYCDVIYCDVIYCDVKGKTCSSLNKCLHETQFPHPSIILIALFCNLKIMGLCDKFPQNVIP